MTVTLTAESGELTVLRTLASGSWGKWSVDWPESVPEDQRPDAGEGLEFGYMSRFDRDPGRMGRRFIRADVNITAKDASTSPPLPGFSDVEQTLDTALERVSSDVFIEKDITRAGLNGFVPWRDFGVGDLVDVVIFGRVVRLPVTSIEAVADEGAVIDWRVHVGGDLLADDKARLRANGEIERAIAQERRERLKAVGKVEAKASAAQASASAAQDTADTVAAENKRLVEALGGTGADTPTVFNQLKELDALLQEQGDTPEDGLIPNYLRLNTKLWEQQKIIDAAQDDAQIAIDETLEIQKRINMEAEMRNAVQENLMELQRWSLPQYESISLKDAPEYTSPNGMRSHIATTDLLFVVGGSTTDIAVAAPRFGWAGTIRLDVTWNDGTVSTGIESNRTRIERIGDNVVEVRGGSILRRPVSAVVTMYVTSLSRRIESVSVIPAVNKAKETYYTFDLNKARESIPPIGELYAEWEGIKSEKWTLVKRIVFIPDCDAPRDMAILLKNTCVCDKPVKVRDPGGSAQEISPGYFIPMQWMYASDNQGLNNATFYEYSGYDDLSAWPLKLSVEELMEGGSING